MENDEEGEDKRNLVRLIEVVDTNCRSCFMSGKHRTEKEPPTKAEARVESGDRQ